MNCTECNERVTFNMDGGVACGCSTQTDALRMANLVPMAEEPIFNIASGPGGTRITVVASSYREALDALARLSIEGRASGN